MPAPSPWPASFTATSDTVTLTVAARGLAADRVAEVWFYPARWGAIEQAAPQRVSIGADAVTLAVARGPLPEAVAAPDRRRAGGGRASRRWSLTPGVHRARRAARARTRRARALAAPGAGAGARRRRRAEPDAVRAAGALDEGVRPRAARERAARGAPRPRHRVHRGRPRIVRRRRRRAHRPAGRRRAAGLGLPAPVARLRHAPRPRALRRRAEPLRSDRDRLAVERRGPGARRARRLRGLVLHGRAGHGRRDAVHGAVHGRGRRVRGHPAVAHGAARVRGARAGSGAAVPGAHARAGVAPLAARARGVDDAGAAAPGVSALCVGRVARVGGEPAGRADGRGRGAGRAWC